MKQKAYPKGMYAILIIALLMLGVFSENIQNNSPFISFALDYSKDFSGYHEAIISTAGKTLPVTQFLSEKTSCTQETVAGIRQRSTKPVLRTGRNYSIDMITLTALMLAAFGIWFVFCHEKREILSNIIIMDYIHLQDGQKP